MYALLLRIASLTAIALASFCMTVSAFAAETTTAGNTNASAANSNSSASDSVTANAVSAAANAGVVNGTSVRSFLDSGSVVNPQSMEKASIPADKAVTLPSLEQNNPPKTGGNFLVRMGRGIKQGFKTVTLVNWGYKTDKNQDASLAGDLPPKLPQAVP